MTSKQLFLITIVIFCGCHSQPQQDSAQRIPAKVKRAIPAPAVKRFELGFGNIELPSTCTSSCEFYIDAYSGDIDCAKESLQFYHEGGWEMPIVMKSDRKAWQEFHTEVLPDGNTLRYGTSKVKEITHCYASICPPHQEFACGSFVLKTPDAKLVPRFLSLVRTFKLASLDDIRNTKAQTKGQ